MASSTRVLVRYLRAVSSSSSSSSWFWFPQASVSPSPSFRVSSISPSLSFQASTPFLPPRSLASLAASNVSASSPPPPNEHLSITDSCVKRLQQLKQEDGAEGEGKMLRVSVEGGGCSGFQYVFTLDDTFSTSDRVFSKDGARVVVDEVSLGFLKGATIDYVEELIRSSFMVIQNPNASGGCGCGSSFNVK